MVGGSTSKKAKPEILEIPKSNVFPNLPSLPTRTSGSNMVGITDIGNIVICASSKSMLDCFNLFINDRQISIWNKANFTLMIKRAYAASIKFQNDSTESWLITGGEKFDSDGGTIKKLDTSEIFKHSNFLPGPMLPRAISMHCAFKFNMTHIVFTGGRGASSRALHNADVLTLNLNWGKFPDMTMGRYGHVCGHYGMKDIVVAGGLNIKKSEIFPIKFSEW